MKVILFNELHEVKVVKQDMIFTDGVHLNVHELLALGGQIVDVFYLHAAQCPAGIQQGNEHITLKELSNAEIKALLPGIDLRKKGQKIHCPEDIPAANYNEPAQVKTESNPTPTPVTTKEDSVKTSNGNISRLPKGLKFIEKKGITKALNIGCGKGYKAHNELLTTLTLVNYDPFIPEVSKIPEREDAQAVVCNNVLNVIEQYEDIVALLDLLDSYELPVYITIYEGDRSGNGKPTKLGTYQRNMKAKDYQILSNRGYTFKAGVWFRP